MTRKTLVFKLGSRLLTGEDVVRHRLVKEILKAYDNDGNDISKAED